MLTKTMAVTLTCWVTLGSPCLSLVAKVSFSFEWWKLNTVGLCKEREPIDGKAQGRLSSGMAGSRSSNNAMGNLPSSSSSVFLSAGFTLMLVKMNLRAQPPQKNELIPHRSRKNCRIPSNGLAWVTGTNSSSNHCNWIAKAQDHMLSSGVEEGLAQPTS